MIIVIFSCSKLFSFSYLHNQSVVAEVLIPAQSISGWIHWAGLAGISTFTTKYLTFFSLFVHMNSSLSLSSWNFLFPKIVQEINSVTR